MFIKLRTKFGLTLVETLISIFILASGLCLVLATFVIGRMSVARAEHRVGVRNILRAEMETLKNTLYGNIISSGPDNVTINAGPDSIEDTADDLIGKQTITVTDKNGYKEVSIALSWNEAGWAGSKNVSEKLVTYIHKWGSYR